MEITLLEPVPAYKCLDGCEISEDVGGPIYECGSCGTVFSFDNEGSNRCPDCNKFAAKYCDISCTQCEGEAEELQEAWPCPECEVLYETEDEAWACCAADDGAESDAAAWWAAYKAREAESKARVSHAIGINLTPEEQQLIDAGMAAIAAAVQQP